MFLNDRIFNPKDKVLKKKNSEIVNRLFEKTQYYVIAVSKRPLTDVGKRSLTEEEYFKVRAYVFVDGYICFYGAQGKAFNKREYVNYIDFVRKVIHKNRYEWTNFWINKGQIITKDCRNNIIINNEMILPFGEKSRVRVDISDASVQICYDALKSAYSSQNLDSVLLEESLQNGTLKNNLEKKIRGLSKEHIEDFDGEIIARTRIEGYNFIISYAKFLANSNVGDKVKATEDFFERVFFLERHGYILDYRE